LKQAEDTSELSNVESAKKKKHIRKREKQSSSKQLVKKREVNRKFALTIDKNQSILNSPPKYDVYKKKSNINLFKVSLLIDYNT